MNALWIFPFFVLVFLVIFGLVIGLTVFWIIMLVSAIQHKFKTENEKMLWVLVIIFAGLLGALIYYFMVYRKK